MEYQFPLVATNRDGKTRIFNDAETFRAFAYDRANGGVGAYWKEAYTTFGYKSVRLVRLATDDGMRYWHDSAVNTWIVRDNRGRVVDKRDFPVAPHNWRAEYFKDHRRAAELGLPIPGTRKRRWHRKSSSVKGRNGAHNQRKGIKLFEDPLIKAGDFSEF